MLYYLGDIVLCRLGGDKAPEMVPLPDQDIGQVVRLAFSPDGETLAAKAFNGDVALWDIALRQSIGAPRRQVEGFGRTAVGFADPDTIVSFNESVSREFTASGGLLARWAVHGSTPMWTHLLLPTEHVYASALAPGGGTLVTLSGDMLSGDRELTVWETQTGQQLARSKRTEIAVNGDLVFDRSGTRLAAVTEDAHVELFDLPSLELSAVQPPKIEGGSVEFSADGHSMAIGGRGAIIVWSAASPMPLSTSLFSAPPSSGPGDDDLGATVGMSRSDPTQLVSVANERLRSWHLPDVPTEVPVPKYHQRVAMSADGSVSAILDYDHQLTMWHPGDRQLSPGWKMDAVNSIALSADGSMLASGGDVDDGLVRLWDGRRGVQWGPAMHRDNAVVWTLAFSPHGDLLASAGYGGSINVWKVSSTSDGTKQLEPLGPDRPLLGHSGAVMSLEFDPSGKRIVSGGNDGTVRLWDVATGTAIGEPMSMGTSVESVTFSPDGRTIAAADSDGLGLWDVATQQMLGPTVVTRGGFAGVSFSADGQRLATINKLGSVWIWDPILWSNDRDAVSERLCAIASRNLTRSEWHQFLPGEEYRQTCSRWPGDP